MDPTTRKLKKIVPARNDGVIKKLQKPMSRNVFGKNVEPRKAKSIITNPFK